MPLITDRDAVLAEYESAAARKWTVPTFCSENLTTTEAILQGLLEYGAEAQLTHLPVSIAITNLYEHRSQSRMYTHTRDWQTGLKLFLNDLKILCEYKDFAALRVMTHLDHTQPELDASLLTGDLSDISSVMFDASAFAWSENLRRTAEFVRQRGAEVVIEGACDEIMDAGGNEQSVLTTPDKAGQYIAQTGVDFMVANLGTEHRASAANMRYRGDIAREIKELIGPKIVLHGCSCVPQEQLGALFDDGVCKVNIWTALERDSSPVLFEHMLRYAEKVAGRKTVAKLIAAGYLTDKNCRLDDFDLQYFTTTSRQHIVFEQMKKIVKSFLNIWYK